MGSEEKPMVAGCSARGAEGAGRDGDVQSPGANGQNRAAGEAEFEDWRLKTSFGVEEHPEGWTPNGGENVQGPMTKAQINPKTQIPSCARSLDIWFSLGLGHWVLVILKMANQFSNAQMPNDEGMAVDALCLFVPADSCGRLGSFSLISSCFHLFQLGSAVLIIKIFFQKADAGSGGVQAAGTRNSAKLA